MEVNTYDAASMDDYQKSMNTMMSPKFQADYKKVIGQLATTIKQAKVRSKGQVLASGVASVDSDSAQVLVVPDASVKTVFDPNVAGHVGVEDGLDAGVGDHQDLGGVAVDVGHPGGQHLALGADLRLLDGAGQLADDLLVVGRNFGDIIVFMDFW